MSNLTFEPADKPPADKPKGRAPGGRGGLALGLPWLIAVALVAATLAWAVIGFRASTEPFRRYNVARLVPDAAAGMTVVALGDSRLRHALVDANTMAALGERHGLDGLRFVRIVHNSAQFSDFEPLLDPILDLHPDRILIHADLLFRRRRPWVDFVTYLRALGDHVVRGWPLLDDPKAVQEERTCPAETDPNWFGVPEHWRRLVAYVDRELDVRPEDSPEYYRVKAFADAAARRGIPVTVLLVPSSRRLEDHFYGPGRGYYPEALARLAGDPDLLTLWSFPDAATGEENYCDFIHMKAETGARYSDWLVQRLIRPGGTRP